MEWESEIIRKYECASGNKVTKSGFVVSTSHPYLGALPDGCIHNGRGVIEVKKVTSKEGDSFEDTLLRLYKKKQGKLAINTNHQYYIQIQQQLFCTGTLYCHFCCF